MVAEISKHTQFNGSRILLINENNLRIPTEALALKIHFDTEWDHPETNVVGTPWKAKQ